jgi:chromosomal replication initiation ATPase DnaA
VTPEQQRALEMRRKFRAAIEAKAFRAAAPIEETPPVNRPTIVITAISAAPQKSNNSARIEGLQKRIERDRRNGVCDDISPAHIIDACAAYYDVPRNHVISPRQHAAVVLPRQVAMYLMRELLGLPFRAVGAKCGGFDHSTAIHATQKISRLIKTNPSVADDVTAIRRILHGEAAE